MPGNVPRPAPAPAPHLEDNVPISQPVFPPPAAPAAMAVEEEEPADGTRFGQYVLLEKIATGGMAEVWKARMKGVEGFQKIVAIKKILPHLSDNREFIDMFIDEAKLAAQLNHNNIIHIYDLGKIQSSYYIAMEFVEGHDLKTILKRGLERGHQLSIELSLFIASKIAAALDYAHRKRDFENRDLGLVHRDVSPQNVLISQEGDIKLCDFGIAKAASKASETQAGALKGKLQYMSPEQAWGTAIDKRSDVFALGAVLFEMLTGRKLFTGDNEMSILEQVREARVEPPSNVDDEISPQIDRIVLKALEKDPANRYPTAADMARDIETVLFEMRPTPNSADLAIYMHRLSAAAPVVAPAPPVAPTPPPMVAPPVPVVEHPKAAVPHKTPPGVVMPSWESRKQQKKPPIVLISAASAAVVIAAVAGFLWWRSTASRPMQQPVAVATPAPKPVVTAPITATVAAPPTVTTETVAAVPPEPDPAKVNEEVQKRLAAERAKLEEQARRQLQAGAKPQPAPPILGRVTPQPVVQPQPSVPVPVPAPQPAIVEQQPVVQPALPPAPQPAVQAEAPRAHEGDLVQSGSEDTPAKMTRRATMPYPPLAKLQRVQGTVLVNALISETGKVLEVKLVRPINKPVGLNEAALQIVRQSTFSPPMKDGVRVKTWTTVPVDFKL